MHFSRLRTTSLLISLALLVLNFAACGAFRSEPEKGVVILEVGVDYLYGGVQPVARQEFYLLDSDITNLLDDTVIQTKDKLLALTAFVQGPGFEEKRAKLTEIIQRHTVAKGTTDLQGKLTFEPIPPGAYYIMGWSRTRKTDGFLELLIWNHKVDVKSGPQTVSLSSSDAAMLAPYIAPR